MFSPKVKIIVIGPQQSGKTYISNYLSGSSEAAGGEYRPTQGVRILEFDTKLLVKGQNMKVEVEMWDTSGDSRQESCWAAIQGDAAGVIFVWDQHQGPQAVRELETLHSHFVEQQGVRESQCIVFTNIRSNANTEGRQSKLSTSFSRITQVDIDLEEAANRANVDFSSFLATVVNNMSDRREQEESDIMRLH